MAPESNDSNSAGGFRSMGRALAHRNYRLFFVGQGVSLVGTWMTRVATYWLVFRLSGMDSQSSAHLLGMVGFAGQVPTFILGPVAGALVDRWNRHRLLIITQVLSLIQSALLAVVAFTARTDETATLAQVFVLAVAQGIINAFDMPCRQSFMVQMIDRKEDLPNAIALNSSLVNGARLVGPAIAGLIIQWSGETWCFVIDAVSYVAVIVSLLLMRVAPATGIRFHAPMWRGMLEGARYAFGFTPIRAILLLLALVSFMGMPYMILLPIFAQDVLKGGPSAYGLLSASAGVGALIGALYLASRRTVLGLGRTIAFCAGLFGVALIGFSFSRDFWLSMLLMALTGMGMMVLMAASNTILQTITDEDKRGRVMSFYSMAFLGTAPFGSLFAGALANRIGAPYTVMIGGAASVLGGLFFATQLPRLRRLVRPLYVKLGIVAEVATGLQAATE
jgi:MFS family permease